MGHHVEKDGDGVLRDDVVAPLEIRAGAAHGGEGERRARARAEAELRAFARRVREGDEIAAHLRGEVNFLRLAAHPDELVARDDGRSLRDAGGSRLAAHEDLLLVLRARVAHAQAHHEAVELRLRQRLRTGGALRVLCGNHDERGRDPAGHTVDGDLPLLHHLKQGALRLRAGAVDLVPEKQVAGRRAGTVLQLPRRGIRHGEAGDVRGGDVGGELQAAKAQIERAREGEGQRRLADAGDILEQDVAAGQYCHIYLADDAVLSDDGLCDLVQDPL